MPVKCRLTLFLQPNHGFGESFCSPGPGRPHISSHAPLEPHWPVGNLDRVALVDRLNRIPGDHLVIVRYGPDHNVDRDWIYNAPDIDRSRIVWARDMGKEKNEELLRYFNSRHAWLMFGDNSPPQLEAYPAQ